ncbi:MAG: septal ring lytic transglycosylase RlpA family protein [Fulvivirga sp.]
MKTLLTLIILLSPGLSNAQMQEGRASFYADKFEGRTTANGEIYSHSKLTAAHKILPFGTMVRITNLENNRSIVARINDRGPFIAGRIIDLSRSAAQKLRFIRQGVIEVKIEIINKIDPKKVEGLPALVDNPKGY